MPTQYIPKVTSSTTKSLSVQGTSIHAGDLMEFLKSLPTDATVRVSVYNGDQRDPSSLTITATYA